MTNTNIGDRVNPQNLDIPIGVSIDVSGRRWVHEVDGWWTFEGGAHHQFTSQFSVTGDVIGYVPFRETLAEHRQRFAVTSIAKAFYAGGGGYLDGAQEVLRRLDIPRPEATEVGLGDWVHTRVNSSLVPVGAVLLSGATDRGVGHSLYVKADSRYSPFTHLSGVRRDINEQIMRIVATPEGWWVQPTPTEEDEQGIVDFRIQAWNEGWREKQSRGWCADFERSMSVLDLSTAVVDRLRRQRVTTVGPPPAHGITPGMVATIALMNAAPIGTIVTEGPGSYTCTKETETQWRSWEGDRLITPEMLYFHPGLTFHSVPEVQAPAGPVFESGTRVNSEQQSSCADGAVFAYGISPRQPNVYVWARSPQSDHRTGNIGITHNGARVCHSSTDTIVVWDGVSPIHESPVPDHRLLDAMPEGTVIGQVFDATGMPQTAWRKRDDIWRVLDRDTGAETSGAMRSRDFSTDVLRFIHIPVSGVTYADSITSHLRG